MDSTDQKLTIFHFNDVYTLVPSSQEPKGGASYFGAMLKSQKAKYNKDQTLTLFSGDAFSPSLLSSQFKGENMVKPLKSFGIDLACYGNHDLDYELEHSKQLIKKTEFPWMLTNIYDNRTNTRLADALESYIIEKNGIKIGFFSLCEKQWIDTLFPTYKEICVYHPFLEFAQKMVTKLRAQKCDMIIALTHMMKFNDIKLAKEVEGIDLVLGGHDHLIVREQVGDCVVVKSGTDFKHFSVINVSKNSGEKAQEKMGQTLNYSTKKYNYEISLKEINHKKHQIQPDPQLEEYIESIYSEFRKSQQRIALYTSVDMDLRFGTIRKQQNSYLEFICSVYRIQTGAYVSICNSGSFRMDTYIKAGPIDFGTISNVIPGRIVVAEVPGDILIKVLEVCVSSYPNLSGRYAAFSGIRFTWDCSKKPGERVLLETVYVHKKPIDLSQVYTVAMGDYMSMGGDGYDMLRSCKKQQTHTNRQNKQITHEIISLNKFLLDAYQKKYPNRFKIIEVDGEKFIQLGLPEAYRIKMICSTGENYAL